jgi:hypothetical protein
MATDPGLVVRDHFVTIVVLSQSAGYTMRQCVGELAVILINPDPRRVRGFQEDDPAMAPEAAAPASSRNRAREGNAH